MSSRDPVYMTPKDYLKGRSNWPGFKVKFEAFIISKGFQGYLTTLKRPTINPVKKSTSSKTITSTGHGSQEPLMYEWDYNNMQVVVLLIACVVDPDAHGLKESDTAIVNWARLVNKFSPKDISLQLLAEDSFSSMTFPITFETEEEFQLLQSTFIAKKKAAIDAGATISDAIAKNRLIAIVSRNTDLKPVALGLPAHATLENAWSALESRWIYERGAMLKIQEEEMKVKAMIASYRGPGANVGSGKSNRLPAGPNLASDICTNPAHGPEGKGGHKTGNCWAVGGANIANKPSTWAPKKSKAPVTSSVTAAPVTVSSVTPLSNVAANSVHCPEVFIFSARAPLKTRLGLMDSDYLSLSERLDMPTLSERVNNSSHHTAVGHLSSVAVEGESVVPTIETGQIWLGYQR
ncbi:hypothetical protein C8J56DRAFT_899923 [Mycena floridula]|nr:hypothetical protein C8J56DRAFT_899923 [Mycena floridula]